VPQPLRRGGFAKALEPLRGGRDEVGLPVQQPPGQPGLERGQVGVRALVEGVDGVLVEGAGQGPLSDDPQQP
jgi:hypothetical protein